MPIVTVGKLMGGASGGGGGPPTNLLLVDQFAVLLTDEFGNLLLGV